MRVPVKYALWLLPLLPLLQGCDQKKQTTQPQVLAPPIVDAPPPKASTVSTADLPPPVIGPPPAAKTGASDSAAKPAEPPKKPMHHRKKVDPPAPAADTDPATPGTPAATATTIPSVSAVGQLSGGASGDLRAETQEMIGTTEKGVNGITRPMSDSELKTAAQIHEFLKQAREALTTGDVDGAHTLAMKAKVLLTELNP